MEFESASYIDPAHTPLTVKSAVAELMSLETDKTNINRRLKQVDSRRTALTTYLMQELSKDEATAQGVVCNDVVVYVQDEEIGVVNDWDDLVRYMQETGDFSLIKKAAISSRIIEEIKTAYDWDFERTDFENVETLIDDLTAYGRLRDKTIYIAIGFSYICVDASNLDANTTLRHSSTFNLSSGYDETEIIRSLIQDQIIPAPPECVEIIRRKKIKLKKLS